jgi:hypothetical protein
MYIKIIIYIIFIIYIILLFFYYNQNHKDIQYIVNKNWRINKKFDRITNWNKEMSCFNNEFKKKIKYNNKWDNNIYINKWLKKINIKTHKIIYYNYSNKYNILEPLKIKTSYCIKQINNNNKFICLVKDNILLKDIKIPYKVSYNGPIKKGNKIHPQNIYYLINELKENENKNKNKNGIIIEELIPDTYIYINIYILLGSIIYINNSNRNIFSYNIEKICKNKKLYNKIKKILDKISKKLGIDFYKVNLFVNLNNNDVIISNFSLNPSINGFFIYGSKYILNKKFNILNKYYLNRII